MLENPVICKTEPKSFKGKSLEKEQEEMKLLRFKISHCLPTSYGDNTTPANCQFG